MVSEPPCGSGAGPSRPESAPAATLSQQGGGIPYHLETYLALDPCGDPDSGPNRKKLSVRKSARGSIVFLWIMKRWFKLGQLGRRNGG